MLLNTSVDNSDDKFPTQDYFHPHEPEDDPVLTVDMLSDARDFLSESLRATYDRVKTIKDVYAQPHIRLLLIDCINYFLGMMAEGDRRQLLAELNEQQCVLDEADPNSLLIRQYMKKDSDLEFQTL